MAWKPIAFLPPQIENSSGAPYSGAVLKAYRAGTSTNIPMATDYTGVTTAGSMVLNASGYPTYQGSIVIPHLSENYKLALYPSQAAADANSGAVWTIDNVQIADATNSTFIQYFDGDGVTSTFTLSQSLGTDENILMVFADRALTNYVTNGDFATDTIWTKGAGWTIAAGVATATGAISTAISETAATPILAGQSYAVEFTVTAAAGTLTPSVGGTAGTTRGAGTWQEIIVAGSTQALAFTGVAFTGTLDNASIKDVYSNDRLINRPDEYTLNGNQLTLNNIPPVGTKSVIVFAPSLLLGAAAASAAAAATSESNAAASALAAATSAAASAAVGKWRPAVACASTGDLTLSGEQTIDGVLTSASRVLVKNQASAQFNGVYVSAAGAWARATDCDSWTELVRQAMYVTAGTANGGANFANANDDGGTLDTTAVTWVELLPRIPFVAASSTTAAYLDLAEDTDNGTSRARVIAPASLTADADITLPGVTGTLSLVTAAPQDFRLTLTSGVPVTTADVTAATTIYCTPYKGNRIALYDGTNWQNYTSTEMSIAIPAFNNTPYDVFCYDNAGVPTLEVLAWASTTTRATALAYQDGVLCKSGALTRRYLGTFCTTAVNGQTEDSTYNRYLWNYYNRVNRRLYRRETTASWTYSTNVWRQANNSTANQINVCVGVAEDALYIGLTALVANSTATARTAYSGISYDSLSFASSVDYVLAVTSADNAVTRTNSCQYAHLPSAGKHYYAWMEQGAAADTQTWSGQANSGLFGSWLA